MRIFLVCALLLFSSFIKAQSLSQYSTISLLTASPGEELYSTFGHSAIRVQDPVQGHDDVFNFGTFDDRVPNFYIKFARRKVDYMLAKSNFEQFTYTYIYENRSIIEQILALDTSQKNKLYELLLENFKPENRFYRYDFFFDNCSTRIRDLMITAFGSDFSYNYPKEWKNGRLTFRNLIDQYLTYHHWSDFGIDLALGLPTDALATPSDYMFLPDYLSEGFATATITSDGEEISLVSSTEIILPRENIAPEVYAITPARLMWGLFFISVLVSVLNIKKGLKIHWFDVVYFNLIGLVGWMVFFLWFFTDHIATKDNLNLCWAFPLYFPLFFFWTKLPAQIRKWFILILGGIDFLILLSWPIFPQHYHTAFIPLILIMLLRFVFLYKEAKNKLFSARSLL